MAAPVFFWSCKPVDLDFVRLEYDITADNSVQLTATLYDVLRSFDAEFRSSCCQTLKATCISCCRQAECQYRQVFGQQLSPDPEIVRVHQKPSLPFSFYIRELCNAADCTLGMVVIGSAVNFLGIFNATLLRMVDAILHGLTHTLHCHTVDYQGVRHEITSSAAVPESVVMLSGRHILENTVHADTVRLQLRSPLRLLSNASIAHRFDFTMFFRSQLRRCSSLCAYYGTGALNLDFIHLSQAAQKIEVLEDNIHYTQPPWSKSLNRAGLTGSIECTGLGESMFPLLLLGSNFNAGKGAAFGSGAYQIEVM